MARIKLFLDEDVHLALDKVLQKRGFDAIHAQNLDRKGQSDSEQLAFTVQQRRTILSFNVKDYILLHN